MKKMTNDWLLSAESDLLLIQKISSTEELTHLAAFHAQQAIEKSLKAVVEEFDLGMKKTHSLEVLYQIVKEKIALIINLDTLILIDQLYIDARYPGEMGLLPGGKPNLEEAQTFYNFAQEIFQTVKSQLNSGKIIVKPASSN